MRFKVFHFKTQFVLFFILHVLHDNIQTIFNFIQNILCKLEKTKFLIFSFNFKYFDYTEKLFKYYRVE